MIKENGLFEASKDTSSSAIQSPPSEPHKTDPATKDGELETDIKQFRMFLNAAWNFIKETWKYRKFLAFIGGLLIACTLQVIWLWQNHVNRVNHLNSQVDQIATNLKILDRKLDGANVEIVQKFPKNGIISVFRGGTQPDIHTEMLEELSLFSDSAHGGKSYVWYEKIPYMPTIKDSKGFLRIHYHLNPGSTQSAVPYVGVFGYFGNPPKMLDISDFKKVSLAFRANQASSASCKYSFHLLDLNAANRHDYGWSALELYIPQENVFMTNAYYLSAFESPDNSPQTLLDEKHVFGFALRIIAPTNSEYEGWLDVGDMRFLADPK